MPPDSSPPDSRVSASNPGTSNGPTVRGDPEDPKIIPQTRGTRCFFFVFGWLKLVGWLVGWFIK